MTFYNKRAWNKLAAPALMQLPPDVLRLVWQVMQDSRGLQQNPDLSMPWPQGSSLRERFDDIPTEDLARASRIVWAAGHWHPGTNDWFRPLLRTGTYWKFASYADEVLRARCEVNHKRIDKNSVDFEIHEGFIRACISFDRTWVYNEVSLATPGNLHKLKELAPKPYRHTDEDYWEVINSSFDLMKGLRPTDNPIAKFFDLTEFYDLDLKRTLQSVGRRP
ncbi:hypothetical protein LCGC14_0702010 [marine sediment metagenome]|uniref:Uncharacterized protein n=1 Tax=marine sediment metagenome TaxID=412755 RepID=A0A0F9QM79_9ZZZZ